MRVRVEREQRTKKENRGRLVSCKKKKHWNSRQKDKEQRVRTRTHALCLEKEVALVVMVGLERGGRFLVRPSILSRDS